MKTKYFPSSFLHPPDPLRPYPNPPPNRPLCAPPPLPRTSTGPVPSLLINLKIDLEITGAPLQAEVPQVSGGRSLLREFVGPFLALPTATERACALGRGSSWIMHYRQSGVAGGAGEWGWRVVVG